MSFNIKLKVRVKGKVNTTGIYSKSYNALDTKIKDYQTYITYTGYKDDRGVRHTGIFEEIAEYHHIKDFHPINIRQIFLERDPRGEKYDLLIGFAYEGKNYFLKEYTDEYKKAVAQVEKKQIRESIKKSLEDNEVNFKQKYKEYVDRFTNSKSHHKFLSYGEFVDRENAKQENRRKRFDNSSKDVSESQKQSNDRKSKARKKAYADMNKIWEKQYAANQKAIKDYVKYKTNIVKRKNNYMFGSKYSTKRKFKISKKIKNETKFNEQLLNSPKGELLFNAITDNVVYGYKGIIDGVSRKTLTTIDVRKIPKQIVGIPGLDKLLSQESKKYIYKRYYSCFLAAAYFQTLVSMTPMDEEYTYISRFEISQRKRASKLNADGKLKTPQEYAKSVVDIKPVKIHHEPDESYLRGDWILNFMGYVFKAFTTDRTSYADYTFDQKYFEKKQDFESIKKIADIIFKVVGIGDYGDLNNISQPVCSNPNERLNFIDKGGWYKASSERKVGAKYTHGVDTTFLTYQAPHGFIEITNAWWKMYANSPESKNDFIGFIKDGSRSLDVSDKESEVMKSILNKYPEIKKTFTINKDELFRSVL